jgi:hypothetical protein
MLPEAEVLQKPFQLPPSLGLMASAMMFILDIGKKRYLLPGPGKVFLGYPRSYFQDGGPDYYKNGGQGTLCLIPLSKFSELKANSKRL